MVSGDRESCMILLSDRGISFVWESYNRLKIAGFEVFGRNPRGFKFRFAGYQELVYMRMEIGR